MKAVCVVLAVALVAGTVQGFGSLCSRKESSPKLSEFPSQAMPENFRVVLYGDQGRGRDPAAVLEQVVEFDPHLVVHDGDFDYVDNPDTWDDLVTEYLGDRFPYFSLIGNHDDPAWDGENGYRAKIWNRYLKVKEDHGDNVHCSGYYEDSLEEDIGIFAVCKFYDFLFVETGVGQRGDRYQHYEFIDEALDVPAPWKMTAVHKNQRDYQTGGKVDEIGWETMEITREHGAFVLMGHEHSYSRTHLMGHFESHEVVARNNTLIISPGSTFAVVSGLAGVGVRGWEANLQENDWWAVCASNDGVCATDYTTGSYGCDRSVRTRPGALYCTLNVDGNPELGLCDFIDSDGNVWDSFTIISRPSSSPARSPAAKVNALDNICTGEVVEAAVESCMDDAAENLVTGEVSLHGDSLPLAPTTAVALRFANAPIDPTRKIKSARLGMAGAVDGDVDVTILVRAQVGKSEPLSEEDKNISSRPLTDAYVSWSNSDVEAWEFYSTWTTPDITSIVNEIVSHPSYAVGDAITFVLTTKNSPRSVFAHDHAKCAAPTLVVEYEKDC